MISINTVEGNSSMIGGMCHSSVLNFVLHKYIGLLTLCPSCVINCHYREVVAFMDVCHLFNHLLIFK